MAYPIVNPPPVQQPPLQTAAQLFDPVTNTYRDQPAPHYDVPSLGGLMSSLGISGAGSGGGTAATPPAVGMPDTSAATAAAFGRAKDQTGLNTRASLTALTDELGAGNMLGSGLQADATKGIIEHGAGQLNEVGREQAIQDALLANDRAKAEYQGLITQRGQNINVAQQNAQQQQQALNGLLSLLNSSGSLY